MPRVVHTADVHLGTPFAMRFSRQRAELRRNELKSTFSKIVDLAAEADFLFISGDLFDGSNDNNQDTVGFLKRKFSDIPSVKVFISAGNHDPFSSDSIYANYDFGDHVHVFGTRLEYFDFPEHNTRIHGVSFDGMHDEFAVFDRLQIAENSCNILVLHGDVAPIDSSRKYNPITEAEIARSGLDYIALGHIHRYSQIQRTGQTCWAYPGIPEGRGFDEVGPKGVLVGTIEKQNVQLSFQEVCKRRLFSTELDVSKATDMLHICDLIEAQMVKLGAPDDLYRFILTGQVAGDVSVYVETMAEMLQEKAYYVEVVDQTQRSYSYPEMAGENSLRGRFVSMMLERIQMLGGEEKALAEMALQYGVESMDQ